MTILSPSQEPDPSPNPPVDTEEKPNIVQKSWRFLVGKPRDLKDPSLFHHISLVAFLAWVGLGADGLSSSAYGPEETFRALEGHTHLAIILAGATMMTVFIISYAYSRIIEHFPHGGGGYVVATKLLGPYFGLISGCALLVDYVLTITVSIASSADQIFSFLPMEWAHWKLIVEGIAIIGLIVINLRGAKESIQLLLPIFMLFLLTHVVVLVGTFIKHGFELPAVMGEVGRNIRSDVNTMGGWAVFLLLARAYSRGAGTYTGIEAVSNGVQIMREPRVPTAKRTMVYMATSLAVTAGGILLAYLLLHVTPEPGKTLNAVMVERLNYGPWFVIVTLFSEGALLIVAAQAGFLDGPRVMANMALDSWLPHRFSSLSERLTAYYGIVVMGLASLATLLYSRGNIDVLVTMYSINVFITFSLTEIGMCKFWIQERKKHPEWKKALPVHMTGLTLCLTILTVVVVEKFTEGAWLTLLITTCVIVLCIQVKRHYKGVYARLEHLSQMLTDPALFSGKLPEQPFEMHKSRRTAVLLVGGYSGLGVHSLMGIIRTFPKHFEQMVFVSVAVIDTGNFKGIEEAGHLEENTKASLAKYVELANRFGMAAEGAHSVGIEAVSEAEKLCLAVREKYPHSTFFAGNLIFAKETFIQQILHNRTAFAIQSRLGMDGIPMMILPIRVK